VRKDAKTRAKDKKAKARAAMQKARADAFFIIYYDFGPERSLEKLYQHLAELGLRRALNTLKNYSVKYDWQQRLIEEDTRRQERDAADTEKVRAQMIDRHSKLGRTLQSLSLAGMFTFQEAIKAGGKLTFSASEIVSLARAGADLELRAAGEPTLRVEITMVLYNVLIARIAHIFKECNKLPTEEARESQFAIRVDQAQAKAIEEANALLEQGK